MRELNKPRSFAIVAIGASAGGLKAFEDLVSSLPPEPGMAFVLVPHLAPQYKSHLTEILARNTSLPINEVKNGDKVVPNRIYVVPPNRAMSIKAGILRLSSSGRKSDHRNPIDRFFLSLAKDQRSRAIGVLLSGEGSDGTDGLRAIKENGGITFAQNERTAAHLSMPRSAVVSGHVDFILSPAGIGKKLCSARAVEYRSRGCAEIRHKPGGEGVLNRILGLLRIAKGIEFDLYKRGTLRRRIQRRMMIRRIRDPKKYLRVLNTDPEELEQLCQDILISVTFFFREPESFHTLKSTIYPRILKNSSPNVPVRIWVPGCSTGEEAYSHAMNFFEFLGKRAAQVPFQIFATDVNPAVIEKARLGVYSKKITSMVSPERLQRFFVRTEGGYRIVPYIRERCIFAVQNLVQDPPFMNLDMISCRNLLIYMGPTLQEKALQVFQYALKPRGILMLGRSETVGDFLGRFSPLNLRKKIFSERTSASNTNLNFVQSARFLETESVFKEPEISGAGKNRSSSDAPGLQAELESVLPVRYTPNGVIINSQLEILQFLGDTAAYLRPAPGKPSMNLRRMASGALLLELRAAIHVSKKSFCVVRKEISVPQSGGAPGRVRVEILPIKASSLHDDYFLVLFEEISIAELDERKVVRLRQGRENRRIIDLKEDLAVSGEHLKAIIEEQESTNAKLKASNEELLSSNEELQSINEEFETSKEELQSTNEELITSTEEIERGNRILNRVNSDLSNLLSNIDIPIVLLGPDLTVRRFTPAAEKVLGLSLSKVGRAVADIKFPLCLPDLKQLLRNVIKNGQLQKLEVKDMQGRWYYLFLRPYRTDTSKGERSRVEGAVMALVDISERKLWEKTVLRLATLVRDSNDAVIIFDLKDKIIAWNKGAQKMYGYTETEALGMSVRRIMPKNNRVGARELIRLAIRGKKASPIETRRRTKTGRTLDVLLTVTILRDHNGRPVEVATTERDVTDRKQSDLVLRSLLAHVISVQDTERKRLARELHDGVGQILSGVKFRLESLPGEIALDPASVAKILEVGGFLNRAISEVRRVSQALMPSELGDLGLAPALRTLCREFKERVRIPVALTIRRVPEVVAPALALVFFRIAQEAFNNIGKHSRATKVKVDLFHKKNDLMLRVSDNGIGFKPGGGRLLKGRGIGLGNMRERAESVGGSIELRSAPGAGTMLLVRVPLSGLRGYIA